MLAYTVMFLFGSIQVFADDFAPPRPFEIWSYDNERVFRWTPSPDYRVASANVYRNDKLIYTIENLPTWGVSADNFFLSQDFQHMIFIPTTHDFQSLNMEMQQETEIVALKFYTNGELVRIHYIADVVNDMNNVNRSVSMAFWRTGFPYTNAMAEHISEHDILRVITVEQVVLEIDLTTGEIVNYLPMSLGSLSENGESNGLIRRIIEFLFRVFGNAE